MWSPLVVGNHPPMRCFTNLLQIGKHMLIEHVFAKCSVEALDDSILTEFARLVVLSHHIIVCASLFERFPKKLGAIVRANDLRQSRVMLDLLKHAD